ncbi:MAG: transcription antitermination factor NusB, partial [Planctomycetota bacterium]
MALQILTNVLHDGMSLSEAAPRAAQPGGPFATLDARDKAFARAAATTTLRMARPLQGVLSQYLKKPLATRHRRVDAILLLSAAQILEMETPAHAVISIAVDQVRVRRADAHLDKLANAVLRKVASSRDDWRQHKSDVGAKGCFPPWMIARWENDYGPETAEALAAASLQQAPLDITVKSDAASWAGKLDGQVLQNGTIRRTAGGRIEDLAGYDDGHWWVQDAASAIPATLFSDVSGKTVLDLCAAPGGKTSQLAALGADVIAVDSLHNRVQKLRENLKRLKLSATCIEADV